MRYRVKLIFEGDDCALIVEPTDEADKALLSAFGIKGELEAHAEIKRSCYVGRPDDVLRVVVRPVLSPMRPRAE